jgi:hypothetical protein
VTGLPVVVLGWCGYVSLMLDWGWTQERYAAGIADTLIHLLLPDDPT